jgi:23S rRNA (uridine2552-2'-O)-methyltransferase
MAARVPRQVTRTGRRLGDADPHSRLARQEGYVARSAYKLLEIQEKHRVIPPGGAVLDLGCHPGAWLQVACGALGPRARGGAVLGVDLQATEAPPRHCDDRVAIVQADARELSAAFWAERAPGGFDTVLSDMCHFTHGNAVTDAAKSLALARTAFELAIYGGGAGTGVLRPGGALVMKLLQGAGTQEFGLELREFFTVKWARPKATRSESKEVFLLGLKRR